MKQLGYVAGKSLDDNDAFVEFTSDTPAPQGHDLLVSIKAISINPVDTKIRARTTEAKDKPVILGWDAAGIVEAVGESVSLFKPGDKVFYAGDVTRPGSYASHQLVDERIVGHMPNTFSYEQAAALPLTSITAWEALFDRLKIDPNKDAGKSILIIGAAGGLGSIAIQLAKQVAGLTVLATASRAESIAWCKKMGADHVLNHQADLLTEIQQAGLKQADYIFCLYDTDKYFDQMAELIAPQGGICAVVDTKQPHNLSVLKSKSVSFCWEFMFTRAMFQTADMIEQHALLNNISSLVDEGKLKTTLNKTLSTLDPVTLVQAHRLLETGQSIGKLVLATA